MFDIGLQEMLVVGVIALLVFGPSKLPDLGRMVGRALREFRRASDEFRTTVETNLHINDPDPPPAPVEPMVSASASNGGPPADADEATAVVPAAEPAAVTVGAPAEAFCAQRGSRLFHRSDCSWVSRIPAPERLSLTSVADGVGQGFARCPVCEPWEPA